MATSELSTGKTIFVLTVVAGCFAVLWPKIFYPMFFGSPQYVSNLEKAQGKLSFFTFFCLLLSIILFYCCLLSV